MYENLNSLHYHSLQTPAADGDGSIHLKPASAGTKKGFVLKKLNIYIPSPSTSALVSLAQGSGIVGSPRDDGRVLIYYEGNIHNASNLNTWQSRLRNAAGRLLTHYPTIAMMSVEESSLELVGELTQHADDDHNFSTRIFWHKAPAITAYTGEAALSLLSAPTQHKTVMALADVALTLLPFQEVITSLVPPNPEMDPIERNARWEEAIARMNAAIVHHLPEIARSSGNSVEDLEFWFSPDSKTDTWFGPMSQNRPADFLMFVAEHQSMNFERWNLAKAA